MKLDLKGNSQLTKHFIALLSYFLLANIVNSQDMQNWITNDLDRVRPIKNIITPTDKNDNSIFNGLREFAYKIIDINNDLNPEVAFKSTRSGCVESMCPIYIGYFDPKINNWRLVGKGIGNDFTILEGKKDEFSDLKIDELIYSWATQIDGYEVDISEFGSKLVWEDSNSSFMGKEEFLDGILSRSLGSNYLMLKGSRNKNDSIKIAGADLNYDGNPEYIIRIQHEQTCLKNGCPTFIYRSLNEIPFAKIFTQTGSISISKDAKEGSLKSIYALRYDGNVDEYEWSSSGKYQILNR